MKRARRQEIGLEIRKTTILKFSPRRRVLSYKMPTKSGLSTQIGRVWVEFVGWNSHLGRKDYQKTEIAGWYKYSCKLRATT